MTNQVQSAQTINTVVEQTSAVMEMQHWINKHLMSGGTFGQEILKFLSTGTDVAIDVISSDPPFRTVQTKTPSLGFLSGGGESLPKREAFLLSYVPQLQQQHRLGDYPKPSVPPTFDTLGSA
ncbi:hypothetical protein STEG23_012774 [Scotinomys teguina]